MKTSHQTFILEMVKHGDKELAWQKANPGNKGGNSARKAADRLLRRHPEMAAEIEEAVATIRHQAYKEAYRLYTEEQRTPLLSMMQRREILARIARGEVKVCRYVRNGDRYIMLFEDPRPRDMMQAMQIDAKFEEACNRMRNFNDPVPATTPPPPSIPTSLPASSCSPAKRKKCCRNPRLPGAGVIPHVRERGWGTRSGQKTQIPHWKKPPKTATRRQHFPTKTVKNKRLPSCF